MVRFAKLMAGAFSVMAAAAIVIAVLVPAETIAASWNRWTLYVRQPATFGGSTTGTPEELGQVTIESDSASRKGLVVKLAASQTADAFEVQSSAGAELFGVDKDGDISVASLSSTGAVSGTTGTFSSHVSGVNGTFSGHVSGTTGTFSGLLTVNDAALIDGDADEVQLRVQSHSTQTSNLIEGQASDGTTDWSIADNGAFSIAILDVTGATTLDGDVTLGDAAADIITCTGPATFAESVQFDAVTEDPCTATGYGPSSVFWNVTSSFLCYCDGSSADLKVSDESTACF